MGKIAYDLEKDGEIKHFDSEKDACEFLNVKQGTVSGDYYKNRRCQGWTIKKVGNQHHESYSRLYRLWKHIKERCYNPNSRRYKDYGARGIGMCDEWKNDYTSFKQWALSTGYDQTAHKYACTIERIDVNGNYEPSNCCWKTNKEQCNNKRNNHVITFNNESHTIMEWSEKTGINYNVLWARINKYRWSIEKSLTTKKEGNNNDSI